MDDAALLYAEGYTVATVADLAGVSPFVAVLQPCLIVIDNAQPGVFPVNLLGLLATPGVDASIAILSCSSSPAKTGELPDGRGGVDLLHTLFAIDALPAVIARLTHHRPDRSTVRYPVKLSELRCAIGDTTAVP